MYCWMANELGRLPPHRIRRRGVARTFQSGRLFSDFSVLDNLEVTGVGLGLPRRDAAAKAEAMLELDRHRASGRADGRRPSLYR